MIQKSAKKTEVLVETTKLSFLYAGKLLLRSEISLTEQMFQTMLTAGNFTPILAIKKLGSKYECQRCGNKKPSLFARLPCIKHKKTHIYCRKCMVMGRVVECEPLYYWSGIQPKWHQQISPLTWEGRLTKEQQVAASRIVKKIKKKESTELLIWAVTGSGKTEMLFPGITKALQLGKRICIATPRADVVRELLPRLQSAFQNISIQAMYGGSEDKNGSAQLIIATTHQLLRFKAAFDLIIIDEIDAYPYHVDEALPFATERAKRQNGLMVYLTATPREEQRRKVSTGKLPHVFVPLRFHRHPLPIPQFKMCFFLKNSLKKYLPPTPFIKWLHNRKRKDRQLLIFVPTIKLANQLESHLASVLLSKGLLTAREKLRTVHSEDEKREQTIQLFRENKLSILITTTILERGVTFASIDVVVLDAGHVVFDEAALVQIAGRAGRSKDDPTGEVVFFHDGKTQAMVQSVRSIKKMNQRGEGGFR